MQAALTLAERGRGQTSPNPNVGCVIAREGVVVGRGWTQPGGRPHAEAMALEQAGDAAAGATCYVTLEPCAHDSPRGPACSDLLAASGVKRVVIALGDPDPRTDGKGIERLRAAGIEVETGILADEARQAMAGFLTRQALGRPHVTLKLAMSLDGAMAMGSGESQWITGPEARAHAHLERSRHEAILVGRETWETDRPRLDVRLEGLENRSPRRVVLSSRHAGLVPASTEHQTETPADEWTPEQVRGDDVVRISAPHEIANLQGVDHLLIEGGAQTAAAFLHADLVDRLLIYRAPVLLGGGRTLPDIGLTILANAHGRWRLAHTRQLGSDRLEAYLRVRS